MKNLIAALCCLFFIPFASCEAPFWYKEPDNGYVYVCENPHIEYVRGVYGDPTPNSTIELDGETIEFDLLFTGMSVDAWKYRGEDQVLLQEDLLFVGTVKHVTDEGFTIELETEDTIFENYDYKKLIFKKDVAKEEN